MAKKVLSIILCLMDILPRIFEILFPENSDKDDSSDV